MEFGEAQRNVLMILLAVGFVVLNIFMRKKKTDKNKISSNQAIPLRNTLGFEFTGVASLLFVFRFTTSSDLGLPIQTILTSVSQSILKSYSYNYDKYRRIFQDSNALHLSQRC